MYELTIIYIDIYIYKYIFIAEVECGLFSVSCNVPNEVNSLFTSTSIQSWCYFNDCNFNVFMFCVVGCSSCQKFYLTASHRLLRRSNCGGGGS